VDLNMVYAQLARVLAGIDHELNQLLSGAEPPEPGSPGHQHLMGLLATWTQDLKRLADGLKSAQHALQAELDRAKSLPRDVRYRATQSATSRQSAVQDAQKAALTVHKRLQELDQRFSRPPTGAKATASAIGKASDTLKELAEHKADLARVESTMALPGSPLITVPPPPAGQDVLVTLSVLLRLLQMAALRWAKKRN
jgi:hypothetical protein